MGYENILQQPTTLSKTVYSGYKSHSEGVSFHSSAAASYMSQISSSEYMTCHWQNCGNPCICCYASSSTMCARTYWILVREGEGGIRSVQVRKRERKMYSSICKMCKSATKINLIYRLISQIPQTIAVECSVFASRQFIRTSRTNRNSFLFPNATSARHLFSWLSSIFLIFSVEYTRCSIKINRWHLAHPYV